MDEMCINFKPDLNKELLKLKIIILIWVLEATLHAILDTIYLIVDPDDWQNLLKHDILNSLLWLFFRWLSNNLWIITTLYVFNGRKIYQSHKDNSSNNIDTSDGFSFEGDSVHHLLTSPINVRKDHLRSVNLF